MDGSEPIQRTSATELTLRLNQSRPDGRREHQRRKPRRAEIEDQIELHDEKIDIHISSVEPEEGLHLDISA